MDNTQTKLIKQKLENGETITSMDAFQYGITRLSAIIYQLRRRYDMNIIMTKVECINRYGHKVSYGEYKLGGNKK